MPAPYSDNLYSGDAVDVADDDHDDDALSPTDGYFRASSTALDDAGLTSSSSSHDQQQRQSAHVPFVPNVMVEDPTLQQDRAAAKAREAEQERLIYNAGGDHPSPSDAAPAQPSTSITTRTAPVPHQPRHHYDPYSHTYSPSGSGYHSHPVTYPHHHPHSHQASSSTIPSTVAATSPPTSPTHHHRRSIEEQISSFQFEPSNTAGQSTNHYTVHQQRDAPPAYSPSPSSPPPSSAYHTFSPSRTATATYPAAMGVPDEYQVLLPPQPESMGGSPNGPRPPMWRRVIDSSNQPTTRKKIKKVLGMLLIISIFFALIGSITFSSGPEKKPDLIDKTPVKEPESGPSGDMDWKPTSGCLLAPSYKVPKTSESVSFGKNKGLEIIQSVERDGGDIRGISPHVYGSVILKPVDASTRSGNIDLEIISNHENLRTIVEYDEKNQRFSVTTPRRVEWIDSRYAPCVQIRLIVSIPKESDLGSLHIDASHLDIHIMDGLVLASSDSVSIVSVSGDIRTGRTAGDLLPYTLASRSITIETISGDINGWFPLYDLLKISTVSGQIGTSVSPKPSSDKNPELAILDVASISGDVLITEPLEQATIGDDKKFPLRDYMVSVVTSSGGITADVAFTSIAKFRSQSGNFKLNLLPLFDSDSGSDSHPTIETDTKSGRTILVVAEPVWKTPAASFRDYDPRTSPENDGDDENNGPLADDEPWIIIRPDDKLSKLPPKLDINPHSKIGNVKNKETGLSFLSSRHTSISGDFKVTYPPSWEGRFTMITLSGSQGVQGKDLKYSRTGTIQKRIQGTKGSGESSLTIASTSGNENLSIGKTY